MAMSWKEFKDAVDEHIKARGLKEEETPINFIDVSYPSDKKNLAIAIATGLEVLENV